ncbi:GntR family transcriptional regulator [Aureibacillus halotolerans]|uniref:Trehalose operon repressor n=2 Tax=Aureibacillus halotolerans TaxID=1508390 RepID=A0A4R6TUM8_9BACI|nr:GntR family transcriptional regulator [Aureibacillus halotolerans]
MNISQTIYQDIASQIKEGQWSPGERLATEHDLSATYATSRSTVHKALDRLSQDGYIQKVQGKGSIVLDVHRLDVPMSGLVSFKELVSSLPPSQRPVTRVHELTLIEPPAWLMEKLACGAEELVWKLVRTRTFDNEAVILDTDFIRQSFVPTLTKSIAEDSVFAYFEQQLGLSIAFSQREMVAEETTAEDESFLDMHGASHLVVVRSTVYVKDAVPLQYTESRHRLDRFRFVDFARRTNG